MPTRSGLARDLQVSERAARQKGLVNTGDLHLCQLTSQTISSRAAKGTLHRLHQGVYAVGHPAVGVEACFLAATTAAGREAALSHYAASALRRYVEWDYRDIEVTIPIERRVRRPGLVAHRAKGFGQADITHVRGIPVTNPARTLLDLAAVVGEDVLRRAVAQALGLREVTLGRLLIARIELGPRRGSAKLGAVLADAAPTRSELEDVVWALLIGGRLKRPEVNPELCLSGRRVVPDFYWRDEQVVVEADSRQWHDNPIARANDAERRKWIEAHDIQVVPVTWNQAMKTPERTLQRVLDAGVPLDRVGGNPT